MSEATAIERVDEPNTVSSLSVDIRELGVGAGDTLLVHSSLSALGWVCGGAQTVVDALQDVVTETGTLVMPAFTGQYTDPATWSNPPVPDEWIPSIRETMPPFRPAVTPTRGMGAIPECFRNYPNVVRSRHPTVSFAAWGADAEAIVADHAFDDGLGEHSPLSQIYDRDGTVLLLGTGHDTNTSFHLAEYRTERRDVRMTAGAAILQDGDRAVVEYEDIELDESDFGDLGADFERRIGSDWGTVGAADARLASQRELVDFAVDWLEANR